MTSPLERACALYEERVAAASAAGYASGPRDMALPGSTSPYRGVSWSKRAKKWVAQVRLNDVTNYLGAYDDDEVAARVARAFREAHMTHNVEAAAA